ncbi:MAG TPA: PKD domain-containing protein [Solirubrobacteraceae bacterium]
MLPFLRALAVAACLLPFAVPATAAAAPAISHAQAQAIEIGGDDDDAITPGDRIRIDEKVATSTGFSGATGTLMSPTPGVSVDAAVSPYPNTAAGGQAQNTKPFEATLAGNIPCGTLLQFTLTMNATGGSDATTFSIPTGSEGPSQPYPSAAGPQPLADATLQPGVTNAQLGVIAVGRVKRLMVTVGSLTHPRLSDLRLALVAPDGAEVVLAEAGTLSGANMTNTVFSSDASTPVTSATGPYTGEYAPAGDLGAFAGRLLSGTWALKVTDTVTGQTGTLSSWGIEASRAWCDGLPQARFTMDPPETVPQRLVKFDASTSTDEGGAITKYEWDLDGDGDYDDGSTAKVERFYPAKAKVHVRLKVTDSDGLVDIEHQVLPVTVKPVAVMSSSPTNPAPQTGDVVRLSAAGSTDGDGTVERYEWNADGNDTFEVDSQGTNYVDVTYDKSGTYTAAVRITDDSGSQATATTQVVVRNRPPTAVIDDPGVVASGRPATLSAASSSDPEDGVMTFKWDLTSAPGYETDSGTSPTVEHTFPTHGNATIGVQVTDDTGSTATDTLTFAVTRAPVVDVDATPNPVSLGEPVAFDASGSYDPDAPLAPLTIAWDLDDDGLFGESTEPAGPTAGASWATAGTRTVSVRVTDQSGVETVGTVDVLVRNMLPVGALSASPATPTTGETVQLSAVGSTDADGVIERYEWDLDGNGSVDRDTGTTPATSTSFPNHGNVTVGVRLTDDDGGIAMKTLIIAVQRADEPDPGDGGGTGGTGGTGDDGGGDTPVTPATGGGTGGGDAGTEPIAPGDGGAGGDQPPGTSPERPFGAWLGGAALQRSRQVIARGLLLSCRSEVAVWCSFTVSLSARDAKRLKLGRKAVTVAKSALPVPEGQSARKRIKLSARARRALRGANGVRLLVRAVARSGDGREVALSRVVLLRR